MLIINRLKNKIKWNKYLKTWEEKYSDSLVKPVSYYNMDRIVIGKKSYGDLFIIDETPINVMVKIGNYCSIAPKVVFLLGAEHNINTVSTYPFKAIDYGVKKEAGSKGDIVIADDVWIGYGAIITSGVTIGQGAVIAAGAVVTKDIPPYAVVGGCPAKIIKYRLSENIRKQLLEVNIVRFFDCFVKDDMKLVYSSDEKDILNLLDKYKVDKEK